MSVPMARLHCFFSLLMITSSMCRSPIASGQCSRAIEVVSRKFLSTYRNNSSRALENRLWFELSFVSSQFPDRPLRGSPGLAALGELYSDRCRVEAVERYVGNYHQVLHNKAHTLTRHILGLQKLEAIESLETLWDLPPLDPSISNIPPCEIGSLPSNFYEMLVNFELDRRLPNARERRSKLLNQRRQTLEEVWLIFDPSPAQQTLLAQKFSEPTYQNIPRIALFDIYQYPFWIVQDDFRKNIDRARVTLGYEGAEQFSFRTKKIVVTGTASHWTNIFYSLSQLVSLMKLNGRVEVRFEDFMVESKHREVYSRDTPIEAYLSLLRSSTLARQVKSITDAFQRNNVEVSAVFKKVNPDKILFRSAGEPNWQMEVEFPH